MVLGEAFYGFRWNLLGASFYFIVIMTLKRYIYVFPFKFYSQLLQWWCEFRIVFDSRKESQYILWNNKQICVDKKPVFYKILFEQGVVFVDDLLFELNATNCFTIVSNKISKVNYLTYAGLCHSVPTHLKKSDCLRSEISLILTIDNKEFDIHVLKKKSKDYCIYTCTTTVITTDYYSEPDS